MKQFRLPDPGEGLVEADIVTWRVAVGDTVKVNDIIVEVETSKSLVELPTPYAGTVAALLVEEGETVDVGTPIITIDDGTPDEPSAPAGDHAAGAPTEGAAGEAKGGRVPNLVGYGVRATEAKRRPRKAAPAEAVAEQAQSRVAETFSTSVPVSRPAGSRSALPGHQAEPVGEPLPGPGTGPAEPTVDGGAVLAKPPVRKLAKDLGVDLATVIPTGAGGVITRGDVEASAGQAAAPQVDHGTAGAGEETRVPVKGVRKLTAEAMVASAFTAPHVTEWLTCDVTASMQMMERLKARRDFAGIRISPLLLVAKAVCLALSRTPELNSSWDAGSGDIVIKHEVNLGIAAATPRGLMVPNIKSAQRLGLVDLARSLNELVTTAREGRTTPADTARGTFTITNVGVFGVDAGTPILNPPESGILCIGAIDRRPWVVGTGADERIEPRWVTTLALSFDHRVVDGEHGSTFLADVAGILRDPGTALLF